MSLPYDEAWHIIIESEYIPYLFFLKKNKKGVTYLCLLSTFPAEI